MIGKFREDIEGLRAVAVLAVIVFHIAPLQFPGGFIGVDVFFVISGYLITQGIVERLRANRFTLTEFYVRRAKRILPANLAVVLITLITGYFLLLPHEYAFLAESAVATALFVSNIFFMLESGYFSNALKTNALLHMWSLSVEEQFYLVFPLIIILIYAWSRFFVIMTLLIISIMSFALGMFLLTQNEAQAFFLAPARFWQFIAGAVLVFLPRMTLPGWCRDGLALVGLLAIAASTLVVPAGFTPPGLFVVPATLAAAVIIFVGREGSGRITGLLLANRIARFIGRISYSAYLVHWPVVVFYELRFGNTNIVEKAGLLAGSLILGALLWRLVEQPFLKLPQVRSVAVLRASSATLAAVVVGAGIVVGADGFPQRYPSEVATILAALKERHDRPTADGSGPNCILQTSEEKSIELFDTARCLLPPNTTGPRLALLGDSHANQYSAGLSKHFPEAGLARIMATGCRPLLGASGDSTCRKLNERAFASFLPEGDYDLVILAGRWRRDELAYLRATVERVAEVANEVVVLGPIVEYTKDLPRILVDQGFDVATTAASSLSLLTQKSNLDAAMRRELTSTEAHYVSIVDAMCPSGVCTQIIDGEPLQYDYGHLTREGSIYVVGRLTTLVDLVKTIRNVPAPAPPTTTGRPPT